jgi:DNA-binding transcriptional MerR regulator
MTEYFQAKDIQIILNIKKVRYEYLASKIGIIPDIEEVEGTGRAHLYSFENLLQFAIAHNANKLGLPLRTVKKLFDYLENYDDEVQSELFVSGIDTNVSIYCAYYGDFHIIFIKGNLMRYYHAAHIKIRELKGPLESLTGEDLKEHKQYFIKTFRAIGRPNLDVVFDKGRGFISDIKKLDEFLDASDGYITINLGVIKNSINSQLEYK